MSNGSCILRRRALAQPGLKLKVVLKWSGLILKVILKSGNISIASLIGGLKIQGSLKMEGSWITEKK